MIEILFDCLKDYHILWYQETRMVTEPIEIDGAFGEGGGQIIRSAVTLSCLTQKPIEITNIRKNRKISGLRAQHMTAIKILAKICNAKVEGLHVGSTAIKFFPSKVSDA